MTVLQVRRPIRGDQLEFGRVGEQLVTGRDEHAFVVKGNATQTPIRATPPPVDFGGVPVDGLPHPLPLEIDQVGSAVTVSLATAPDHRRGYQCRHKPLSVASGRVGRVHDDFGPLQYCLDKRWSAIVRQAIAMGHISGYADISCPVGNYAAASGTL